VRFLVDRCAGKRIAAWLGEQGYDVAVAWDEDPDPGDAALLARAARENRILITMDKDFGEHVFVKGSPHCGLVRLPDVPAARRVILMEAVLKEHARELNEHAIITVRGERMRISRRPVE
jgi:predicted nuclease of predicted toxin-antitoxin system